jgi:hypothetical protein
MTLIVPMAGKSSRYPGVKPKWMLAHPNGKFMAIQVVSGLNLTNFEKIVFVYLKEHEEKFHFEKGFLNELAKVGITNYTMLALDKQTKDVTETVLQTIDTLNIKGSIFIKDSDSFFTCKDIPKGNFIVYAKLQNTKCRKPASSSFIVLNENNVVTNIVEKQVISQNICVGGYIFENVENFVEVANSLKSNTERYVSDVIYFNILHKKAIFRGIEVEDLEDWGTLDDWMEYQKSFATLFVDIDGVVVEHSSTHFPPYIAQSGPIQKNVDYLKSLPTDEVELIFVTSRNESYRKVTEEQLKNLGLHFKTLIMGLSHSKRVIINDFSSTNPYRSCDAVNMHRNHDNLAELLRGTIQ